MQIQLSQIALDKLEAGYNPIILKKYVLGTGFGYIPSPNQTELEGDKVYEGTLSDPYVKNANVVKYSAYLDFDTGDFEYGEIQGYDSEGDLFFTAVRNGPVEKKKNGLEPGDSQRIDVYVNRTDGNFLLWLDWANSNNAFRLATVASVDALPPSRKAIPNAYIVRGAGSNQSSFQAYADEGGLWNFDAYKFSGLAGPSHEILEAGAYYVDVPATASSRAWAPDYYGHRIIQFISGPDYGIVRYVRDAQEIPGNKVRITFATPLEVLPVVGDSLVTTTRESSYNEITMPIASKTRLGAVQIGNNIEVTDEGIISVVFPAQKVTSVNGMTGDVVIPAYQLPVATKTVLGGVTQGPGVKISATGELSVDLDYIPKAPVLSVNGMTGNVVIPAYQLPKATTTVLGGVTIGSGILVDDGKISIDPAALPSVPVTSVNGKTGDVVLKAEDIEGTVRSVNSVLPDANGNVIIPGYVLPIATKTTLGGIRLGDSLIDVGSGVIEVNWAKAPIQELPVGSKTQLGILQVGDGLEVTDGVVKLGPITFPTAPVTSVNGKIGTVVLKVGDIEGAVASVNGVLPDTEGNVTIPGYVLPVATTTTLGGMIVGDGLAVDANGKVSVNWSKGPVTSVNGKTGVVVLSAEDIEGAVRSVQTLLPDASGNVDLPFGSKTQKGLLQVGTGLKVSSGTVSLDLGSLPDSPVTSVNNMTGDVIIPNASATTYGLVLVGAGLKVENGEISLDPGALPDSPVTSVNGQTGDVTVPVYTLPAATQATLGGVIVGDGLKVLQGKISVDWTQGPSLAGYVKTVNGNAPNAAGNVDITFELPTATATVLGGIKVGQTLIIDDGVLNVRPRDSLVTMVNGKTGDVTLTAADIQGTVRSVNGNTPTSDGNVTLPYATPVTPGLIKIGTGLTISQGVVSIVDPLPGYVKTVNGTAPDAGGNVNIAAYALPVATASVLGGIKVSTGLSITADGKLSVNWGSAPAAPVTSVNGQTGAVTLDASHIQGAVRSVNGITPTANGNVVIPNASKTVKGLMQVGDGLTVSEGVVSLDADYEQTLGDVLRKSLNLSDVPNKATARTNLGLGNAALQTILTGAEDGTSGRVVRMGDLGTGAHPSRTVDYNELPQLFPWSGFVPIMPSTTSTNRPNNTTQFYHVLQSFYDIVPTAVGNVTQVAIPYRTDQADMYMRSRFSNVWTDWQRVLSTRTVPDDLVSGLQYRRDWVVTQATSSHWAKAFRVKGAPGCRATITVTGGAQGTTQGASNTAGYSVMSITKGNVISAEPERDSLAMQYINSQGPNPSVAGIHIVQEGTAGDNWVVWVQARSSTKIIMSYVGDFEEIETFSGVTQADRPTGGYNKDDYRFDMLTTAPGQGLGTAAYRDVWDPSSTNRARLPDVNNVNQAALSYGGDYKPTNSTSGDVMLDTDDESFYGLSSGSRVKSDYLDTTGVDYGSFWYVRLQRQYASTKLQFLYGYGRNEIFFRSRRESNATLPFARIWHSQNLPVQTSTHDYTKGSVVKVGAFGIGSSSALAEYDVFPGSSLNDANVPSGMYYVNSAVADRPDTTETYTIWHRQIGSSGAQIMVSHATDKLLYRNRRSGTWGNWVTVGAGGGTVTSVNGISPDGTGNVALPMQTSTTDNTAGRILTVGAFGLGSIGAGTNDRFPEMSLNAEGVPGGTYFAYNNNTELPSSTSTQFTIWHRQVGTGGGQIAVAFGGTMFVRGRSAGTWGTWNPLATTTQVDAKANSSVRVIAGTGLTGGGALTANRTLNLAPATASVIGGVKPGTGLSVAADGTLTATGSNPATPTVAGVVKPGSGLTVSADGTLTAVVSTRYSLMSAATLGSSVNLSSVPKDSYSRKTGATATTINVATDAEITPNEWHFRQAEAGAITFNPASGVTINPPFGGSLTTAGPGATVTLKRVAANVYDLFGQTGSA